MRAEYDDVDSRKLFVVEPETLSNDPFESVPIHSTPCTLFSDGKTETGLFGSVWTIEHHETGSSCPYRIGKDVPKLGRVR